MSLDPYTKLCLNLAKQVEDVSLTVGVGGDVGSEIFDRARGIGLTVRRPLRDLWHKVPVIEATVKVIHLRSSPRISLNIKHYSTIYNQVV